MGSRTAEAIGMAGPFASLEEEAFGAIQRLASQLLQDVADLVKPVGLTPTQYNVLRILGRVAPEGLSCGEITDRLVTRDPDMTRLLKRLAKQRLVSRSRQPADQRVVVNRITPAGVGVLMSLKDPIEALQRRKLGGLGNEKLKRLIRIAEQAAEGS